MVSHHLFQNNSTRLTLHTVSLGINLNDSTQIVSFMYNNLYFRNHLVYGFTWFFPCLAGSLFPLISGETKTCFWPKNQPMEESRLLFPESIFPAKAYHSFPTAVNLHFNMMPQMLMVY